jgi:hypothetical protein
MNPFCLHGQGAGERMPELEFLNNLWGLGTEYRKRTIVPARQATKAGGIHSLESIPGLHKRLKKPAQAVIQAQTFQR